MKAKQRIEHVVVLMLENRSFDQMLGTLPGVEGVVGADGKVKPELFNHLDPTDADSKTYPVKLGAQYATPVDQRTAGGRFGGPSHSFYSATEQLYGVQTVQDHGRETTPYHQRPKFGTSAGFVSSFHKELKYSAHLHDITDDDLSEVMSVFTEAQVPAISTLAKEFCVCDHWFSELPGPTEPNRLFVHAATSTGLTYNPWRYDVLDTPTIYDRLDEADKSWAFYGFDLFDSSNFAGLRDKPQANLHMSQFYDDAKAGKLPFYSFLCPRYSNAKDGMANSEHAPYDVRYGEQLISEVYAALRGGPKWNDTLFVLLYDEHGGYYDHVPPPAAPPPDGFVSPNAFMKNEAEKYTAKAYLAAPRYEFDFSRRGFRVPAVLVSPWIAKGTIDTTTYGHTSLLTFLERLLDLEPLTSRDESSNSFEAHFEVLDAPREDCPATLPLPPPPDEAPDKGVAAKLPNRIKKLVTRYTANLDGHPDSGRAPTTALETHGDASAYAAERRTFHRWYHEGAQNKAKFEIYEDNAGAFRWRLEDDGDVIARSTDAYKDRKAVEQALLRLRFLAPLAKTEAE